MKHTLKRFAALLLALVLLTGLLPSALADGAEPTNVALGKTVTDGGWGNPAGWPYWDVSFLTDGDNHDLSGGNDVGWSSLDPIDQNQDVELTIDLAGSYDVSKISVYPTVFDAGKFFPGAYTVYISADGTQWEEVASDTFEDVPAVEAQEYTFETKTAAYVRVTITEHRFADNKYVSQLGQIEVYGVEHIVPKELTLLSAGKPVSATSNHTESFFNASFLTDGIWKTYGEDGNYTLGWCCMPGDEASADHPMDVTINLQAMASVKKIVLKPQKWSEGKAFPKAYDLQVSKDGITWTTVASASNVDASAADNASVQPLTYVFDAVEAAYVRIRITEHSELVDTGTGARYSAIGEFEVWGEAIAAEAADNVAIGQKVTADNYFEEPDSTQHYSVLWLVDGKYTDGSKYGYSTKKGITSATDSPATILVELEGVYDVSRVTLVPVQVDGGVFFPEDYAIQLSEDGETWTELVSVTGAETGTQARNHDAAQPIRAKYVRLQLTKHRYATGSYRGQAETLWASRISELEVYGEAVRLDQPTINKTGLQMNAGSADQLSVSWRVGDPLDTVTWTSSDSSVVTVDNNGAVAAVANGTAIITGTYPAGEKYDAGTVTCEVTISDYKATDNLMITAFWPMIRENMNQSYVNDIAEAGFTNIQLQYSLDVANYDDNMTIIGMAQQAGIGVTVNEKAWGWGQITGWSDDDITAAAQKYSHIPGVIGYFLIDEPGFQSQPPFYHCFKAFRDAMPEADVHFNFLGDLAGMEELMQSEAGPYVDYLMWDAYIYLNEGVRDNVLFNCSNRVRELGLKYGVKTAQYVQSCGFNNTFRRPDGDELRYNVNAALAYGNKQIAYFTYRRPEGVTESFTPAIVNEDGTRTDVYDAVKGINTAALQLGPTLMSVEALEVYHTGAESGANNPLPADFFLQPTSSSGRGLIVSYMKNLDTNQNYVMLVNRDYENAATVSFTVDEAAGALQYVSQADGSLKALTGSSVELAPGGCILIKTADSFDYTPDYGKFVETPAGKNAAAAHNTTVQASGTNKGQLTDGARIPNTYTDGCGLPGYTATVGEGHAITLDFGGAQTLNRVDLYPGAADKFPTSFVLEGSADGKTWTELDKNTAYVLPENLACSLTFETAQYQYLRLTVLATESGELQICELEAYNDDGTVPALRSLNGAVPVDKDLRPADNLARGAVVSTSSSHPSGAPYWTADKINDGVGYDAIFTASNAGWSSDPNGRSATQAQWVAYDLGQTKSVNKVVAYNAWHDRGEKKAECYPADYMIQVSNDGTTWTDVVAVYNDTNWTEVGARVFEFDAVNARYVRFYGERLGRCGDGFCLQLSELEVYGGDPVAEPADKTALNAAITAAEALNEDDYTAESWAAVQDALTAARNVADAEDASQDDVDAATAALTEAMKALEQKPAAEPADKDALNAVIAEANALNANSYTEETWAALQEALAAAEAVANDPDATQESVDNAAAALRRAIAGLEAKPVTPGRPVIKPVQKPSDTFKGTFVDVNTGDWFYDAVKYVYENGLFKGVTDTEFRPSANMNRAMLVTVLYRLAGEPAVRGVSGFSDVASESYYSKAVLWARDNGIVTGVSENCFNPNGDITREQMAAILYRYAKYAGMDVSARADLSSYADAGQISNYAKEAMSWAVAMGLISGRSASLLAPTGSATRAEVATILMRFENLSM